MKPKIPTRLKAKPRASTRGQGASLASPLAIRAVTATAVLAALLAAQAWSAPATANAQPQGTPPVKAGERDGTAYQPAVPPPQRADGAKPTAEPPMPQRTGPVSPAEYERRRSKAQRPNVTRAPDDARRNPEGYIHPAGEGYLPPRAGNEPDPDAVVIETDPAATAPRQATLTEMERLATEIIGNTGGDVEFKRIPLENIGISDYIRRKWQGDSTTVSYITRADQVIAQATLKVAFETPKSGRPDDILALEIWVNGATVTTIAAPDLKPGLGAHVIPIDPALMSYDNSIIFKLITTREPPFENCVAPKTWSLISHESYLEVTLARLPVINDLAVLPMPFIDPIADRRNKVEIPVVLGSFGSEDAMRAAFITSSYMGLHGVPELSFPVSVAGYPDRHAVVIATSDELAAMGIAPVTGPTLRLMDNPVRSGVKLLIVAGRTYAEAVVAAQALAMGDIGVGGAEYVVTPEAANRERPKAADDWLDAGQVVKLGDLEGGDNLIVRGRNDARFEIKFKIKPDVFFWPQNGIPMLFQFEQKIAEGARPSNVTVEINGHFVRIVQRPSQWPSRGMREMRFNLPRAYLRAHNELIISSEFEPDMNGCPIDHPDEYTAVGADSYLDLRGATSFNALPDISKLTRDGHPLQKSADLSETAMIMPPSPTSAEMAALMAVGAHLAYVTAYPGIGVTVHTSNKIPQKLDKHVVVIGSADNQPLLNEWTYAMPAHFEKSVLKVREPTTLEKALAKISGRDITSDVQQARVFQQGNGEGMGAIVSFESPLMPLRTAFVVTANQDGSMPNLMGIARVDQVNDRRCDLVVSKGGQTRAFFIGRTYSVGELSWWRRVLWFFSIHSLLLFPLLVFCSMIFGAFILAYVQRREKLRLEAKI